MSKAKFITFEGIECAGKSTQVKFLADYLLQKNIQIHCTREPGGTVLGDQLRQLLASHAYQVDAVSELLMMFASRSAHVSEVIRPMLQSGTWVLCDRFVDASYAYQGAGRQVSQQTIASLELLTCQDVKPDITFLLDLPISQMLERMQERSTGPDRIELESQAFFEQVRAAYLQRASDEPDRFVVLDAGLEVDQVSQTIIEYLQERCDV
jgi:dTMP kinase